VEGYAFLREGLTDPARNAAVAALAAIAREIDATPAQLALAWCLRNPRVSTVIMGASRVQQLHDNLRALEVLPRLTEEIAQRVDAIALPLAA
jgi:aryl-alcohol dehydrogenase-like predicted oxidoreductase